MVAPGMREQILPKPHSRRPFWSSKAGWRLAALVIIVGLWQALAISGLFYRGVIPPIQSLIQALIGLLLQATFWSHIGITLLEVVLALGIGGSLGVATGMAVGSTKLLRAAYEPALHYLAPTPKIVLLPILISLFGVGPGSKIAMGALSCFFPIALSVASGMAQVNPVHLRVAQSFGLTPWQTLLKVKLPSLVAPLITGFRLGIGVAVIGCLLSEIKLSNRGLGYLAIQYYGQFKIPEMYSVLIVAFLMAGSGNALISRLGRKRSA